MQTVLILLLLLSCTVSSLIHTNHRTKISLRNCQKPSGDDFEIPQSEFKEYLSYSTKKVGKKVVAVGDLRGLVLLDADGVQRSVGEITGDDKSIVVFLRHLG